MARPERHDTFSQADLPPCTEKFEAAELVAAAALAKDAAPYVHPRLAAIEQSGPDGGPAVTEVVYRCTTPDECESTFE